MSESISKKRGSDSLSKNEEIKSSDKTSLPSSSAKKKISSDGADLKTNKTLKEKKPEANNRADDQKKKVSNDNFFSDFLQPLSAAPNAKNRASPPKKRRRNPHKIEFLDPNSSSASVAKELIGKNSIQNCNGQKIISKSAISTASSTPATASSSSSSSSSTSSSSSSTSSTSSSSTSSSSSSSTTFSPKKKTFEDKKTQHSRNPFDSLPKKLSELEEDFVAMETILWLRRSRGCLCTPVDQILQNIQENTKRSFSLDQIRQIMSAAPEMFRLSYILNPDALQSSIEVSRSETFILSIEQYFKHGESISNSSMVAEVQQRRIDFHSKLLQIFATHFHKNSTLGARAASSTATQAGSSNLNVDLEDIELEKHPIPDPPIKVSKPKSLEELTNLIVSDEKSKNSLVNISSSPLFFFFRPNK